MIDQKLVSDFPILSKLHFYLNSNEKRFNIDVKEFLA